MRVFRGYGEFNSQNLANTVWAFADGGRQGTKTLRCHR